MRRVPLLIEWFDQINIFRKIQIITNIVYKVKVQ